MGLEQHAAFDITTARSTPSAGNLVGSPALNAQQVLDRGFPRLWPILCCHAARSCLCSQAVGGVGGAYFTCALAGSLPFIVIRRHVSISAQLY